MQERLGSEFDAFRAALAADPPISLRLNPAKPGADFPGTEPVPWCSEGLFLPERPRFVLDPLIHAGAYYVQEAASMLVGQAVPLDGDLRVLDLCAAPGGKSTLLSSRLSEGSLLVSNEIVGQRARVLEENISRWGAPNCVVTRNRPQDFAALPSFFDRVFVDAPCSGEGMFRKDPDVIGHWSPKTVSQCAERQREILSAVDHCLAPGGYLVYSTCTWNREENEDILDWLLSRAPGQYSMVEMDFPEEWGAVPADGRHPEVAKARRCYLHRFRGEGFFIAALRKEFSLPHEAAPSRPSHKAKKENRREQRPAKDWKAAAAAYLNDGSHFEASRGEAWPADLREEMAAVTAAMQVLKAGIRLGELKRDQLIPDHDLAMSTSLRSDVPRVVLDREQALRYLKREPLDRPQGGMRGWALATYEGLALGWVKVLDNRLNSHLPRQLRIRMEITEFS